MKQEWLDYLVQGAELVPKVLLVDLVRWDKQDVLVKMALKVPLDCLVQGESLDWLVWLEPLVVAGRRVQQVLKEDLDNGDQMEQEVHPERLDLLDK